MSKWILIITLIIIPTTLYFIERKPLIICRIPCNPCKNGYVEQDMTKEAVALKGRTAFIKAQGGKHLRFDDCFGLKKDFFSREYTRHGDLIWEPIFSKLKDTK